MFKVMLACDADLDKLRFPLLASAKLDGVRAYVRDGVVMSRSNKPIPNQHVQALFKPYEHFDGELIVGEPTSKQVYRDTVSGVMSRDGRPDVRFFAFDHVENLLLPYMVRSQRILRYNRACVVSLEQNLIANLEELFDFENACLELGYEGLILRRLDGTYKCGRSTVKEGYLLKLKRFTDDEAVIINFEERQHNGNTATVSELGRTKRSSHKAGKSGRGDLGALVVRHKDGIEFNIGTGFTDAEREDIWNNRDQYLGKLVKYKSFLVGVKSAPRHPSFLGFRSEIDV